MKNTSEAYSENIKMARKTITNKAEIEEYFCRGHFDVLMPDEAMDDYDNAIGDYFARQKGLGECLNSNGSEASLKSIGDDGLVRVTFNVYEREYERGSWDEKCFEARGNLVLDDGIYEGKESVYKIIELEEIIK